jgi:hypothetical protein
MVVGNGRDHQFICPGRIAQPDKAVDDRGGRTDELRLDPISYELAILIAPRMCTGFVWLRKRNRTLGGTNAAYPQPVSRRQPLAVASSTPFGDRYMPRSNARMSAICSA